MPVRYLENHVDPYGFLAERAATNPLLRMSQSGNVYRHFRRIALFLSEHFGIVSCVIGGSYAMKFLLLDGNNAFPVGDIDIFLGSDDFPHHNGRPVLTLRKGHEEPCFEGKHFDFVFAPGVPTAAAHLPRVVHFLCNCDQVCAFIQTRGRWADIQFLASVRALAFRRDRVARLYQPRTWAISSEVAELYERRLRDKQTRLQNLNRRH